jgi:hypothetical protein
MQATSSRVKSLYRILLKEARRFPSIKRDGIYQDIRAEFRDNAVWTDPAKIARGIDIAERSLVTLQKYTRLDPVASSWQVDMEQDPLGAAEHDAAKQAAAALQHDGEIEVSGPKPTKLA